MERKRERERERMSQPNALHFIMNQLKITTANCLHRFLLCLRSEILIIHKVTGQKARQPKPASKISEIDGWIGKQNRGEK